MGRKRHVDRARDAFKYDREKNQSICLICEHKVPGDHLGNIEKHLQRKHPVEFSTIRDSDIESIEPPAKKSKIVIEYDKQELLDAWLDLVTVEGRPFSLLDSKSLRSIVKPLFDALHLNLLTSDTVAASIRERAAITREKVRKLLDRKMISLKIDSASRHRHRVVCINAQLVVDGKIVVRTLSSEEMKRSHHGKHIKEHVLIVLKR